MRFTMIHRRSDQLRVSHTTSESVVALSVEE
jgi:hypothetical protein